MAHSLHSLHTFALNSQCQNFVEITQLEQLKTQNFSA
ncbi:MAG: UDP-N-acetylmuramate dehydrogenase, partial [Pseudoalteromonas distincta]